MATFFETITAAVNDIIKHGFDSQKRIDDWLVKIRKAAFDSLVPTFIVERTVAATMQNIYKKMILKGGILKYHPGVSQYTLDMVKPKLRRELDKRIMANASLIKLNREAMVQKTLQRFSGWSTSIPDGGTDAADKIETKNTIRKAMAQLPFEERRVAIDQGAKFVANLNNIIAVDRAAIAAEWQSHWRKPNYNYRPDHKERDRRVYAIRGNWALEKGLMTKGPNGYTDEITMPGEEVYCFPGDSKVPYANGVAKAFRRWYSGELTEIVMASGKTLRATANHPVMTTCGWRAIGSLNTGDDVIEIAEELYRPLEENQYDGVATIAEIFGALNKDRVVESLDLRAADFHGDGTDGKVDVIFAARKLSFDAMTPSTQSGNKFGLADPLHTITASGTQKQSAGVLNLTAQSRVGIDDKGAFFGGGQPGHTDSVGLGGASNNKIQSPQVFDDVRAGNIEYRGKGENAIPFAVQSTKVIEVNRISFSGHVYNLETKDGWYVTDGILTHNCQCNYTYIYDPEDLPADMLTQKGRAAIAKAMAEHP